MENTLHGFESGVTYRLHLQAAGRQEGSAELRILLDETPLPFRDSESLHPTDRKYQSFTSEDFQFPTINSGGILTVNSFGNSGTASGVGQKASNVASNLVIDGGTLIGSGSIDGNVTIHSGGTLASGTSIQSLTVAGDRRIIRMDAPEQPLE